MSVFKNYVFSFILIAGVAIGGLSGAIFGADTVLVKPVGDMFLNLMFVLIIPLVFFSVSSAICNMRESCAVGKVIRSIIIVFLLTATVAATMAYIVTLFYNPFEGVSQGDFVFSTDIGVGASIGIGEMIVRTLTVPDFLMLFSKNNLLPLILFSILFGVATSMAGERGKQVAKVLNACSDVILKMMGLIMYAAPIGLGCYFAYTVGQLGGQLLNVYVYAFGLYLVLATICYFVLNSIYAFLGGGEEGLVRYWRNMLTPSLTAIATSSSAACIPANIAACKGIGVPDHIAETVIPLGANMHKDGSAMGGILKIVFLITIFGQNTPLASNVFVIIGMAILVGAVMGAIPSGGMTGELLICSVFGFPPEMVGTLMIISTIIDVPATLVNSSGNIACSMMISRLAVAKDWIKGGADKKKMSEPV